MPTTNRPPTSTHILKQKMNIYIGAEIENWLDAKMSQTIALEHRRAALSSMLLEH